MDDLVELVSLNKETKQEKRKTLPTGLRLKPKILEAVDRVASEAGMSRTEWIRGAVMRSLKNWRGPMENAAIWGPCRHCGHHHDPEIHG